MQARPAPELNYFLAVTRHTGTKNVKFISNVLRLYPAITQTEKCWAKCILLGRGNNYVVVLMEHRLIITL